jgi:monothiol glutaredoxin
VGVLSHLGVKFRGINVLEDDNIREGIKAYSDWPTIPQLYVKGEFVGGCDIIREMYETGELTEMLQTHGINVQPS